MLAMNIGTQLSLKFVLWLHCLSILWLLFSPLCAIVCWLSRKQRQSWYGYSQQSCLLLMLISTPCRSYSITSFYSVFQLENRQVVSNHRFPSLHHKRSPYITWSDSSAFWNFVPPSKRRLAPLHLSNLPTILRLQCLSLSTHFCPVQMFSSVKQKFYSIFTDWLSLHRRLPELLSD